MSTGSCTMTRRCVQPHSRRAITGLGWPYLALTVSGAVETVIPRGLVPDHAIFETDASRSVCRPRETPIPKLGEQKLPLLKE